MKKIFSLILMLFILTGCANLPLGGLGGNGEKTDAETSTNDILTEDEPTNGELTTEVPGDDPVTDLPDDPKTEVPGDDPATDLPDDPKTEVPGDDPVTDLPDDPKTETPDEGVEFPWI